jgi:hypothetical protein
MPTRSTETTVLFRRPFVLPELDKPQPAGTYGVVTDEDEIQGLSFLAFQRVGTLLRLPALATSAGLEQMVPIDPAGLSAALKADEHEG